MKQLIIIIINRQTISCLYDNLYEGHVGFIPSSPPPNRTMLTVHKNLTINNLKNKTSVSSFINSFSLTENVLVYPFKFRYCRNVFHVHIQTTRKRFSSNPN